MAFFQALTFLLSVCALVAGSTNDDAIRFQESLEYRNGLISSANCTVHYHNQTLDHFSFDDEKFFTQRFFVCDGFWSKPSGPIFFYFGNEADVTLYINHTGLMFENAPQFGALMIFAEHR